VQYAECEYLHGFSPDYRTHFGSEPQHHWRLRISSLAYCTHAVTPVMYVTDAVPIEVSAFVIPVDPTPESLNAARRGRGIAAVMLIRMDTGAYLKTLHGFLQGEQEPVASWVRIHGSQGLMENLRQGDSRRVRVRKEEWATTSGQVEDTVHDPAGDRSENALVCESFALLSELASLPTSTSTGASQHRWSGFVVCDLCSTAQSPLPFLIFARSTSAAHMRLTIGTAWKDCPRSRMGSRLVGVPTCFAFPRVAFLLTERSCLACSFFKDPSLSASERIHQTSGRAKLS
jgi:hypothetical protein